MSFLKKLFGAGSKSAPSETSVSEPVEVYQGYSIFLTPMKEGQQYRLCAKITKPLEGEIKEHLLIRADIFSSLEDANQAALTKAKLMIDQEGDRLLS